MAVLVVGLASLSRGAIAQTTILGNSGQSLGQASSHRPSGTSATETEPPDVGKLIKGWEGDAEYERDRIADEDFLTTLKLMADYEQNYFRQVHGGMTCDGVGQSGCLKVIAMSRRFGKLVEQMREGGPAPDQVEELLAQFRHDIRKFRDMRAKGPENGQGVLWAGMRYSGSLEDQSDHVVGLAYRLNATELLIGQFALHEGLPLLMESFDARSGTIVRNWTSIAYACDKILSAAPTSELRPEQAAVREEYLAWKSALPEKTVYGEHPWMIQIAGREIFDYEIVKVPSYRSTRRPYERATTMGAPIDWTAGAVELEVPPILQYDSLDRAYGESQPHAEVVAFARRFLDSRD
jgi:hypothetical protein